MERREANGPPRGGTEKRRERRVAPDWARLMELVWAGLAGLERWAGSP